MRRSTAAEKTARGLSKKEANAIWEGKGMNRETCKQQDQIIASQSEKKGEEEKDSLQYECKTSE